MKKFLTGMLVTVVTLFVFIACSDFEGNDNKTVDVKFVDGYYRTKAISVSAEYKNPSELYWAYTATKLDNGGKTGQTTSPTSLILGSATAGLNDSGSGLKLSTGDWKFVLWGFSTVSDLTSSTTSAEADDRYVYKAVLDNYCLTFSTNPVEIELLASVSTTSATNAPNGSFKLETKHGVTDSDYSVKYNFTTSSSAGSWTTATDTAVEATSCKTVYLGLFTSDSDLLAVQQFDIAVYRGLTTVVGGTWDDPVVLGYFDITTPLRVTFHSRYGVTVDSLLVTSGSNLALTTSSDVTDCGVTWYNHGWSTGSNITTVVGNSYTVTADTDLYAVWTTSSSL